MSEIPPIGPDVIPDPGGVQEPGAPPDELPGGAPPEGEGIPEEFPDTSPGGGPTPEIGRAEI